MNKAAVCRVLSLVVKVCSLVSGLAAYSQMIPAKYVPIAVLAFAAASIVKDAANRFEDAVNRLPAKALMLLIGLGVALCFTSACANDPFDTGFRRRVSAVNVNAGAEFDPTTKDVTGTVATEFVLRDPDAGLSK